MTKYGKIIELLLRDLFREISIILPPRERTGFLQLEMQIGKSRPFGKFGLGEMIDFFSKSEIFSLLNNFLRNTIFNSNRLNDINSYRIDQTHYDVEILKAEVDNIRKDVTSRRD